MCVVCICGNTYIQIQIKPKQFALADPNIYWMVYVFIQFSCYASAFMSNTRYFKCMTARHTAYMRLLTYTCDAFHFTTYTYSCSIWMNSICSKIPNFDERNFIRKRFKFFTKMNCIRAVDACNSYIFSTVKCCTDDAPDMRRYRAFIVWLEKDIIPPHALHCDGTIYLAAAAAMIENSKCHKHHTIDSAIYPIKFNYKCITHTSRTSTNVLFVCQL